jgi:hypothetical protein
VGSFLSIPYPRATSHLKYPIINNIPLFMWSVTCVRSEHAWIGDLTASGGTGAHTRKNQSNHKKNTRFLHPISGSALSCHHTASATRLVLCVRRRCTPVERSATLHLSLYYYSRTVGSLRPRSVPASAPPKRSGRSICLHQVAHAALCCSTTLC